MSYGLACSIGRGMDNTCEPTWGGLKRSWRRLEEYSDATYTWWLVSSEHGSHELFGLHCPAGRPSVQQRKFHRLDRWRAFVVLLRRVWVQCLEPRPVQRLQRLLPQQQPPYHRSLGSLLEGLGWCLGDLTIPPTAWRGLCKKEIELMFMEMVSIQLTCE